MPEYDRSTDPDLTPAARRGEQAPKPDHEPEALDPTPFNLMGDGGKRKRKRFTKIAAEIERNRRGEYKVPTWALAAVLVAFIAAWVLWIVLA